MKPLKREPRMRWLLEDRRNPGHYWIPSGSFSSQMGRAICFPTLDRAETFAVLGGIYAQVMPVCRDVWQGRPDRGRG